MMIGSINACATVRRVFETKVPKIQAKRRMLSLPEVRQHILLVCLQSIFLISAHKINIELSNSRASQRVNLFDVCLGGTEQAEAIRYFIRHEVTVAAVDFAMMKVIVLAAIAYIRGERSGKLLRFVARNQIDDVVRHQRREPAHTLASQFHIVRDPDWRGGHDLDCPWISSGTFGTFVDKANAPLDQVGISELQD